MKKYILSILFIVGIITVSNSQNLKKNLDLEVGKPINLKATKAYLNVIEGENGTFYAVNYTPREIKHGIQILEFDRNMNETKRSNIDLKFNKDELSVREVFFNTDRITLILSSEYKKGESVEVSAYNIDPNSLKPISSPKLLLQFVSESRSANWSSLQTMFSRDMSKLLLFRNDKAGKKEKTTYTINVFDASDNFSPIWEQSYQSDEIDKLEDIANVKVNNEGGVYLMAQIFNEKRKTIVDGKVNYKFKLKEFSKEGKSMNSVDLDLGDEFITQISIAINQNDDIVCTGFYSSKTSFGIKGCFYKLLDHKSKTLIKESKKEFSLDFITSEMSEKAAKKVKKKKAKGKSVELASFQLRDIVLDEDVGVIQVAERYYVRSHTYTDANGVSHTYYTYHYDDIIVISISPEGEIEWARKIQKRQSSRSPNSFMSYHLSIQGDKLYFFFNGNAESLLPNKKKSHYWSTGKKAAGIIVEVNEEGYMKKDIFYDYAGHRAFALIGRTVDFEDELIFMSQVKKEIKFMKLKFKD